MAAIEQSFGLSFPGLRAEFASAMEEAQKRSIWRDLCTEIKSTKDQEDYAHLSPPPPLREWGTGRLVRAMFVEKYNVKNMKYEAALEIDRDAVADQSVEFIRHRVRQLAERAEDHKDALCAELLVNGTEAGFIGMDGQRFFSASHASGKSGTQDNTVTATALDEDEPTVTEIRAALKKAIARLMQLRDAQGEPVNQAATGLWMLVPLSMYVDSLEAVYAGMIGSTSNVLQQAATIKVHAFARLEAPSKFYLLKTDSQLRPLIFQNREEIEFKSLEGGEDDFKREVWPVGVRGRYRVAFGDWSRALLVQFDDSDE